jgi:hypothetical protein
VTNLLTDFSLGFLFNILFCEIERFVGVLSLLLLILLSFRFDSGCFLELTLLSLALERYCLLPLFKKFAGLFLFYSSSSSKSFSSVGKPEIGN